MSQTVTLKGNPIRVDGDLPATGTLAPAPGPDRHYLGRSHPGRLRPASARCSTSSPASIPRPAPPRPGASTNPPPPWSIPSCSSSPPTCPSPPSASAPWKALTTSSCPFRHPEFLKNWASPWPKAPGRPHRPRRRGARRKRQGAAQPDGRRNRRRTRLRRGAQGVVRRKSRFGCRS